MSQDIKKSNHNVQSQVGHLFTPFTSRLMDVFRRESIKSVRAKGGGLFERNNISGHKKADTLMNSR